MQLNAINLLNERDPVITRVYNTGGRRLYRLPAPRDWFVTTTLAY